MDFDCCIGFHIVNYRSDPLSIFVFEYLDVELGLQVLNPRRAENLLDLRAYRLSDWVLACLLSKVQDFIEERLIRFCLLQLE